MKKYASITTLASRLPANTVQPAISSRTHFAAISTAPMKNTSNAVKKITRAKMNSG